MFAQGALWQFRGWKYADPVTLFSHAKGYYLHFEDPLAIKSSAHPTLAFPTSDPASKLASTWNVTPLSVHKTKRHLDVESLLLFWAELDKWMISKGLLSKFFVPSTAHSR